MRVSPENENAALYSTRNHSCRLNPKCGWSTFSIRPKNRHVQRIELLAIFFSKKGQHCTASTENTWLVNIFAEFVLLEEITPWSASR